MILLKVLAAFAFSVVIEGTIDGEIEAANSYAVVHGNEVEFARSASGTMVKQELDLMLTPEQARELFETPGEGGRRKRNFRKQLKTWPYGVIIYEYGVNFPQTSAVMNAMNDAFRTISSSTCITFRKRRPNDENYITIIESGGCWSAVGMNGGEQKLSLGPGCKHSGVIQHEILHALGFLHEQSRPDRDSFVSINYANVDPKMRFNFDKAKANGWASFGSGYDYMSLMHYGEYAFSTSGRQKTIIAKDPAYQTKIGKTRAIAESDIQQINEAYDCPVKRPVTPPPPTTTPIPGKKIAGYRREGGYIVAGNDIKILTRTNEQRCADACKANLKCLCITYRPAQPGRCHLKSVCAFEPHAEWISLIKDESEEEKPEPPTDQTWLKQSGYIEAGNNIKILTGTTEAKCLLTCRDNPECLCITYNKKTPGSCHLKSSCKFWANKDWISLTKQKIAEPQKTLTKLSGYIHDGNDISKLETNPEGCLKACIKDKRCKCATQKKKSGLCFLKSKCGFTESPKWWSWV